MNSALYEGTVRHRRFAPVRHAFRYRVGMLYLDLDELPGALDASPLWSARRAAPGRVPVRSATSARMASASGMSGSPR